MRRLERGFTLVEIMIVVAIIALLASIAIPNVLRGRATANETAAIGNLRALLSSLEMYRSVNNAYPANWSSMQQATPPFYPMPFSTTTSNIGQVVQGYTYAYTAGATGATYTMTATPGANTGSRGFFTNESGLTRHCLASTSSTADANDNTIDGAPLTC